MLRPLIYIGLLLVLIGELWPWVSKIPLFRLPGDLTINRSGLKVFIPITSMILISVIVSLLLTLFRR
jgi:hypothetical protein